MSLPASAQSAFISDSVEDAPLGDGTISSRLKAEEYRAEDLDGILDSVSSTGNLNFAVLQAGLSGAALGGDANSLGFDGARESGANANGLGRQFLGDTDPSSVAEFSSASSLNSAQVLGGLQSSPLYNDINDSFGPNPSQNAFSVNGGASFSAHFSVTPLGAVINELDADPVAPEAQALGVEFDDGAPPDTTVQIFHPAAPAAQGNGHPSPVNTGGDNNAASPDDAGADGGGASPDAPLVDLPTIDEVAEAIDPIADPETEPVGGLNENVSGVTEETLLSIGDGLENIVGGASEILDPLLETVSDLSHDILGGLGETVDGLLGGVSGVVDSLLEPADGLLGGVFEIVEGLADPVTDIAGDIVDNLSGALGDAVDGLLGDVTGAVDSLLEPASGLLGGVSESVVGLTDPVTDLAGDLVGNVGGSLTDTVGGLLGGGVSDGSSSLLEPASGLLGGVSESVVGFTDPVTDLAGDLVGNVGGSLGDAVESVASLADTVADQIGGVTAPIVDAVSDVAGGVVDDVGDLAETVVDDIGGVTEPLLDAVSDIAGGAADDISDTTETVADQIDSVMEPVVGAVSDVIDDTADNVGDLSETIADQVGDATEPLLDTVLDIFNQDGGEPMNSVEMVGEIADDGGLDMEGADELVDLDVDPLLSPLTETVDAAQEALGSQEGEAVDLSVDVADNGDALDELIGDIALEGAGEDLSNVLDIGADLPEPDSVISEGLSLVDEGLDGLINGGGGLFG